jgi:single-strand DNA-binding protein
MELNKVLLIGNLTHDPESRHLQNGSQVCKLRIAANRRTGGGQGAEKRDEVLYIDVETWQRTAELCAQYLRKGSQVLVEGRLKMDQFQTQAGENRTKILIVADRVTFGSRPDSASGGAPRTGGAQQGGSSARPATPAHSGAGDDYGDPGGFSGDGPTEDDLPF